MPRKIIDSQFGDLIELSTYGSRFLLEVGVGYAQNSSLLTREELVQLKTMIEETLNGSNTTDQ